MYVVLSLPTNPPNHLLRPMATGKCVSEKNGFLGDAPASFSGLACAVSCHRVGSKIELQSEGSKLSQYNQPSSILRQ